MAISISVVVSYLVVARGWWRYVVAMAVFISVVIMLRVRMLFSWVIGVSGLVIWFMVSVVSGMFLNG